MTKQNTLINLTAVTAAQMQDEFEAFLKDVMRIDLMGDGMVRHVDDSGAFGYGQPKGKKVTSDAMMSGINLAFHAWAGAKGYNNIFLTEEQLNSVDEAVEALRAREALLQLLKSLVQ